MVVAIQLRVALHFFFQLPVAQFQNANMGDQNQKNQKKDDDNRHELPSVDNIKIRKMNVVYDYALFPYRWPPVAMEFYEPAYSLIFKGYHSSILL